MTANSKGVVCHRLHQLRQIYKVLIQINKGEEESAGKLVVNVTPVQQQSGSIDSGIFGIL